MLSNVEPYLWISDCAEWTISFYQPCWYALVKDHKLTTGETRLSNNIKHAKTSMTSIHHDEISRITKLDCTGNKGISRISLVKRCKTWFIILGLRRVLEVHVLMKSNPSPRNKTKHRSLKAPMLVPPSFCCTAVQPRWPLATSPNSQPALPLEMLRYSHELLIPDLGQHSVDGRNLKKISWSAFQTTIYKHLCFMYTIIFT